MGRVLKKIAKYPVKFMAQIGFVWPFANIYSKVITEIRPDTEKGSKNKMTILALSPERFRGDLEILAESDEFYVLKIPSSWQVRLLDLFWRGKPRVRTYLNPDGNERLINKQKKLRKFLQLFLSSLYKRRKVDCVVGANINYINNYDWGLVSQQIGVPYIILHRENLATSHKHQRRWYDVAKEMKRFPGAHVVVHNNTMRNLFIRSGFVEPEKISALGALRMDKYVRKIAYENVKSDKHNRITFFSFTYGTGLARRISPFTDDPLVGFRKLFEHTHCIFTKLAMENRNLEFVIKPKWGGNWVQEIDKALNRYGIDRKDIENLRIVWDTDVHELILESDVVCGFGSTTLLEAAIAGKPVIVPHFEEAAKNEYSELIPLKDHYHLFDVAYGAAEFEELILKKMRNSEVSESCMQERFILFEEYVSSMKGDALEKYTTLMKNVITQHKKTGRTYV